MSLLTIRCWLHVIETLRLIRTSMCSLEQHLCRLRLAQHGPETVVYRQREGWELQVATEGHKIKEELQVLVQGQEADDKLLRLRPEA